jgi:glycosyltransferase involved in cell wall biosynthesis
MTGHSSVSACIPNWNGAVTLAKALASVSAQTVGYDELIVVDDGSTDASVEIALPGNARFARHGSNLGRGAARATAVREARGELILFCDAGIELPPRFLELARERMRDFAVAGVFGWVNSSGSTLAERWRARHLFKIGTSKALRSDALLATGCALLRRAAILEAGNFRADLRAGEDAELGRRLLARGYSVIFDPALEARGLSMDGIGGVLRRYARWNSAPDQRVSWADYSRLVSYSIRVMAREDLRCGDFASAALSLVCPHFQFWTMRDRRFAPTTVPTLANHV